MKELHGKSTKHRYSLSLMSTPAYPYFLLEASDLDIFLTLQDLTRQLLISSLLQIASHLPIATDHSMFLQPHFLSDTLATVRSELHLSLSTTFRHLDASLSRYLQHPPSHLYHELYRTDKSCPVRLPSQICQQINGNESSEKALPL